jgi:alkanesulfonate monooxygenase SsuD/methylene tetrahydromethanopterin reductase-like flavin-dependent oxidoreductase (luciferase family)
MAGDRVKFGLTLPNRGVVIGATTVAEMLQLAADAESSGWDSVWVGDSIFAKPRLDAMVLMGAIAARTTRVCESQDYDLEPCPFDGCGSRPK